MTENPRTVTSNASAPFIDPAPPREDAAKVDALLAPFEKMMGRAPDALRLMSVSPPVLENYIRNIGHYMNHASLSPALAAMIRYLASTSGGCSYCIDLNERMLLDAGCDLDAIRQTRDNPEDAPLESREVALLRLVFAAVNHPHEVQRPHSDEVRAYGWSDGDIFDALYHGHAARALGNLLDSLNLREEGVLG
jgi:alkylhydroperoxidase family enzyme